MAFLFGRKFMTTEWTITKHGARLVKAFNIFEARFATDLATNIVSSMPANQGRNYVPIKRHSIKMQACGQQVTLFEPISGATVLNERQLKEEMESRRQIREEQNSLADKLHRLKRVRLSDSA